MSGRCTAALLTMEGERFEKKKQTKRRMKREAFQLQLEARAAEAAPSAAVVAPNPFVEMSVNDLVRSMPVLDDLGEAEEKRSRPRDGGGGEGEEDAEEPSKRAQKKSKAKKRTKMTSKEICAQWDKVLQHQAFEEGNGAAVPLAAVQKHIAACFDQGLLK